MKIHLTVRMLLFVLPVSLLPSGCVKTRTVTEGGRVVSQGPVLVSPRKGTIRSHEDRR
jgi:hypothetical protein